jgi:hypothetical protein
VTKVRTSIGVALGLMLGAAPAGVAQPAGTAQVPSLRLEWEQVSLRGQWRNLCGRVYNDGSMTARRVFIMFEGLDDGGQVVSSRSAEVIGDVPSRGSAIFCLLVPVKGVTYRVTVPRIDWGDSGQ